MYKEPPFDPLYGYRGHVQSVDVLSPYEMLLHYSTERILPPTNPLRRCHAEWTAEGKEYYKECCATKMKGHYKPGEHYTALPGEDRILMPDLRDLNALRHCWCWQTRPRPHLPTWSFAKIPRLQFSPEENARLLPCTCGHGLCEKVNAPRVIRSYHSWVSARRRAKNGIPSGRLSRLKVRAPPKMQGLSARKRRHIQMKLTEEEKYSFQVININDYRASTSRRKTTVI